MFISLLFKLTFRQYSYKVAIGVMFFSPSAALRCRFSVTPKLHQLNLIFSRIDVAEDHAFKKGRILKPYTMPFAVGPTCFILRPCLKSISPYQNLRQVSGCVHYLIQRLKQRAIYKAVLFYPNWRKGAQILLRPGLYNDHSYIIILRSLIPKGGQCLGDGL